MAQVYTSDSSPFYRNKFPVPPLLDKGNLGPPAYGPYQQRWDPNRRIWLRPDGSRAPLSGLGALGAEMNLPVLDLSPEAGTKQLFDKPTFITLAAALTLGLSGGWALQHRYKLAGAALLGLSGVAAIIGVIQLKRNADAVAARDAWADAGRVA